MKVFIGAIFFLSCLSLTLAADEPSLVVELFRHGIRTPGSDIFTDRWKDYGLGELTSSGMRQHYILGAALKELYPNLFKTYSPDQIMVHSTQENRTINSAISQLYGIFYKKGPNLDDKYPVNIAVPPYNKEEVEKALDKLIGVKAAIPNNYAPLPIHTVLRKDDFLLQSYLNCPNANKYYQQQVKDAKVQEIYKKFEQTIGKLADKGVVVKDIHDLEELGDTFISHAANQVELPGGFETTSDEFKDLRFFAHWYEIYPALNLEIQRQLFAGPLLNTIVDIFKQKQDKKTNLNFVFYSAKETMLATILSALGVTTPECLLANWESEKKKEEPPFPQCDYPIYASNLIFEYYNTENPYVKFVYNGNTIKLCDKKETCTLKEFSELVNKVTDGYTLTKFHKWCGNTKVNLRQNIEKDNKETWFIAFNTTLMGVIVVLFISLLVICKLHRKQKVAPVAEGYTNLEIMSPQ